MKEIKAIIQPHMLEKVMTDLRALPHFPGVSVSECKGQGRGRGTGGKFVSTEENIYLQKMIILEVFCDDSISDELVEVIKQAAYTGNPGDGIIMVADLPKVIRIRTGETQSDAV